MKRLSCFLVLCGIMALPAYADKDACETIITGGWNFGCDSTDNGANDEYDYNVRIQTIGASYCRTPDYDYGGRFYNASFICTDRSGSSDDEWQAGGTNYCKDTLFENEKMADVAYQLWDRGTLKAEVSSYDDEGSSTGLSFNNGQQPCVKVVCRKGYAMAGSVCVPVADVVKCKESSNNEHPGTRNNVSEFACSQYGGTRCLQTGSNTYLYCYTEDELRGMQEQDLLNSCRAGVQKAVSTFYNSSYFECDASGKWQKHDFDRCTTGDQFPGGCNGVAGCVDEIVDASTGKSVTNAQGVGQQLIIDTGMTYCMRSVCDADHEFQNGKCVSKQAIADQNAAKARANAAAAQKKQNCENSFGTWSAGKCVCDGTKNLVSESNNLTCKCIDAKYERNPQNKTCELTSVEQRKKLCEAAASAGAYWNVDKCACSESHKSWNGTTCTEPNGYAQCQQILDATWNTVTNQCVCNDTNKVLNVAGTKCDYSEEYKSQRAIANATSSISMATGKLDSIVKTLEVNKWKDEEGKFNTARLASDSIAGVVLGTAGGLITSSVVKKHQVEEGFEDLQCVIGGQTVAGWGDEFNVGVQ